MTLLGKELEGYFSLVAAFISYLFYFRSVMRGTTKPHAFSWATWGILTSIAFYAQYSNGAGAGAWASAFVAAMCFIVAVMALFWGEKNITRGDWVVFISALMVIPLWYFSRDPLLAVVMIIFIDALGGYYPTFRKSYCKPYEEQMLLYLIGVFQLCLSLLAMERYYLVNILYPIFIIIANLSFCVMVIWRRRMYAEK